MRNFLLFILASILLSACSVERLVSTGDYDRGLDKAIQKYVKTGKIKTEDLKAAERAYKYIQSRDVKKVQSMALHNGTDWNNVRHLMQIILDRQEYIEIYQPIISKTGYRANFESVSIGQLEEQVFAAAQERDFEEIESLQSLKSAKNTQKIFDLYKRINIRQNAVRNSIPLVSSDGYEAQHIFYNVGEAMATSKTEAVDYAIDEAKELILLGTNGNKAQSRKALAMLEKIERYGLRRQEISDLIDKAIYYGTTRVLVKVENRSHAILFDELEAEIRKISIRDYNSDWVEYYYEDYQPKDIDKVTTFVINDIAISPSQEIINHYDESKRVNDGWRYVYDKNGNVKKDSLGNDIKKEKFKTIKASVAEIKRYKEVVVTGKLETKDMRTGRMSQSQQVNVNAIFESIFGNFKGDARALSDHSRSIVNNYPEPFPTDIMLTLQAVDALKSEMSRYLRHLNV